MHTDLDPDFVPQLGLLVAILGVRGRAHPIFAALACVKSVEEVRMTNLVGR